MASRLVSGDVVVKLGSLISNHHSSNAAAGDKFRDKPLAEAAICQTLGRTYFHQGEYARASAQFERALQLRQANLGLHHPDTVQSMTSLGSAYVEAGRPNDALPLHEQAVKLSTAMLGPEHQDTLSSSLYLAWAYRVAGHPEKGVPLLEDTLKLSKAKLGEEHPQTLETMNTLALVYQAAGRVNEALPLYEETLKLRKDKLGPEHQDTLGKKAVELVPENGIFWTTLGVAKYRAGSQRDAIAALEKSMQLRNGGDAKAWFFLAMAHWQLGNKVQARKWYDQAAQWTDKHQPQDEELSRFRSEAGELLEVGTKSGNRSTGSAGTGIGASRRICSRTKLDPYTFTEHGHKEVHPLRRLLQ